MLIYVNITDRQTDRQTDKHIKSIVRNLTQKKNVFHRTDGRTTQNYSSEPLNKKKKKEKISGRTDRHTFNSKL